MEIMEYLSPGLAREEAFRVEEEHTAYHIGSGDERVLGTPWMISFMERVSNRLLAEHLPPGFMSVGVQVNVKHLAATPVNASIRVLATIAEIFRNRVTLEVAAWDHQEKIGEGSHTRVVVDKERFMKRVMEK